MRIIFIEIEKIGTHVYYFEKDTDHKAFTSHVKTLRSFNNMVINSDIKPILVTRKQITDQVRISYEAGYTFYGMAYSAVKDKIII